jgi:integrase
MTNHNVKRAEKLIAQRRRQVDSCVARVSPVNRADFAAHVEEYWTRCRASSVEGFAIAVLRADEALHMNFRDLDVDAARRLVSAFRAHYSEASLRSRVILARQHLRWLFGVKRLDEQGSTCRDGKAIERALNIPKHKPRAVGQVLSREQQERLVAGVPIRASLRPAFPMEVRDRWVLRGLKGTGDRVSKFVSLRLRDVRTERHTIDGLTITVARLDIDRDAPDLKTTASARYIREGVSELLDWLKVHPGVQAKPEQDWSAFDGSRDARLPDAPLMLRSNSRGLNGVGPDSIAKTIDTACRSSGLDKELPARLTPHDFRHTAATEDGADHNWNDLMMRLKYDWGQESRMPSHYAHLNLNHQRDRLLRDAACAMAPQATPTKANDAMAALLDLVQQAARQMGGQPSAAPAT